MSRGGGRGDAVRRLLESRRSDSQEKTAVGEEPQPSTASSSDLPMAGGRGMFLSRLASGISRGLLPRSSPAPSYHTEPTPGPTVSAPVTKPATAPPLQATPPSQPAQPLMGMGRAKLLSMVSRPKEPQDLLTAPVVREAKTTSEVSRGALTSSHSVVPLSSHRSSESPTGSLSKLAILELDDEHLKPPVVMKGSTGSPVNVACNYVRLSTQSGKGIFQYDVKFKPAVDARNTRFHILKQISHLIGDTKSFDGAILYLPTKLPDDVTYATAAMPTDKSVVKVKITFVKSIPMGHPHAIHMYNVLFRRIMTILGLALHGRHFFDPHGAKPIPEFKLEVWPGFVTAIQNFEGGVMLCCDASYRVLRTQTVYELMTDLSYASKSADSWKEEFVNLVVGVRVLTRYNNKVYRVDDVDFSASPRDTFKLKSGDGQEISYIEYYKRHYDLDIQDHGQPLLKSKVKLRIRGEETSHMVDLVPELCYLSGISDAMRSDFKVMKSIAQCTRIPPAQRQIALNRFIGNINKNEEVSQLLGSWGITLAATNEVLPARTIDLEKIFFGRGTESAGTIKCDWTRGATNNPVLSAVNFDRWVMICTERDRKIAEEFIRVCQQKGPRMGLQVANPRLVTIQNDDTQKYLQQLMQLRKENVDIVVILLPLQRADKYAAVKKYCCIDSPVPSQVVLTRTIRNPDKMGSIVQKILLQMNCKLGGTLWTLKIPLKNTMVIGIDTYHDAKQRGSSVGAIVASLNAPLTRWFSRIYSQDAGQELIDGLVMAFVACLHKYKETNGNFPDQVIIYRDGVGDGQLSICKDYEVQQLVRAASCDVPGYEPKFLFVVCQKQINTRFFAKAGRDFVNPSPGTVMDHTITRRELFDFFLVSQSVNQGTVSPTHYIVIHNTTSLDADKIQRITYKMTHLYYNWCGTVRVPAPCQYAHKLASLVGESIHKDGSLLLADKLYYL
ncbi:piwi-like [Nesidiocoris tenuis]|uniref:Piwi-like n=1 Tax=Nesidiocoris tenuis TaxID=355587 RepID=A0ABN7A730_9HEMI|nr:piwi-like [Nesidiocoris tenuis]